MVLTLYFTACTLMGVCRDERITLIEETPVSCLRTAQPRIAQWSEQHPGYQVRVWRCGQPPRERRA